MSDLLFALSLRSVECFPSLSCYTFLERKSFWIAKQDYVGNGEDAAQAINGCNRLQRWNQIQDSKEAEFSKDTLGAIHLEIVVG
jgi:hypothetical protein